MLHTVKCYELAKRILDQNDIDYKVVRCEKGYNYYQFEHKHSLGLITTDVDTQEVKVRMVVDKTQTRIKCAEMFISFDRTTFGGVDMLKIRCTDNQLKTIQCGNI